MGLSPSSLFCCCKNEEEARESQSRRTLASNSPWDDISTPAAGRISHSSSRLSNATARDSNVSARGQWVISEPPRRSTSRRVELSVADPQPPRDPVEVARAARPPARKVNYGNEARDRSLSNRWKSSRSRERPVPQIGQAPEEQAPLLKELYSSYQHHLGPYNPDVNIQILDEGSRAYNFIHRKFMCTTQSHFRVHQIERVNNMFLKLFYLLKKEEYEILYGKNNVKEEILFHGSSSLNISRICIQNFNWRFHKRQCLFGKGVNFSDISNYASNYCDKTEMRVMIAAKVLRSQNCTGTNNMVLPPYLNANKKIRFDTSQKPDGNVIVKYNDDEFYPEYVIYFTGETKKKTQYA